LIGNKNIFVLTLWLIIILISACADNNAAAPENDAYFPEETTDTNPEKILLNEYNITPNGVNGIEINPESGDVYDLSVIKVIDSYDSITGESFKLICGECTPESEITIEGDNITRVTDFSGRSRFFIPVYFKRNFECEIIITAKNESVPEQSVTLKLTPIDNITMSTFTMGKNNFIHWPDISNYLCDNYLNDRSLANIYTGLESRYNRIRDATGKDTKLFILLAPDPLVMYEESASDKLANMRRNSIENYNRRSRSEIDPDTEIYTAMNQISDYINSRNPDFTLVDMTPILRNLKSQETYPRLYHTTDNHWSNLGAYYGYYELMNFVCETSGIAATKPLELSDFDIVDERLSYNIQAGLQDPASENIYEVVDRLIPKTARKAKLTSGQILNDGKFWSDVRDKMSFTTGNDKLPTAVFLRDSFTTALYPMLNEHFNNTYYSDTWDYSLDYEWLAEVKPDYVFIIAVERLVMSALSQR